MTKKVARTKLKPSKEQRLEADINYYYREVQELRESKEFQLGSKLIAYRKKPLKTFKQDFPNPKTFIAKVFKPKRRIYKIKEYLPRKKRIYFLVTNTYDAYLKNDLSGIHRVVLELALNLSHKKRFIPVYLEKDLVVRLVKIQKTSTGYKLDKNPYRKPRIKKGDAVFTEELDTSHTERLKNFFELCSRKGVKSVGLIHDIMPIKMKGVTFDFLVKSYRDYYKLILKDTDQVLTISNHVKQDLMELAKKSRIKLKKEITVFHNGVEPPREFFKADLKLVDPEALNFFKDSRVFLSVGTIQERKGYPDLIKAFKLALLKNPKLKFCIAGRMPGVKSNSISKSFDRLKSEHPDNFIFLNGPNDATLSYTYSRCHCYVAASIDEGFGLPIVEASQYRPHILARDIQVFREIAGDNIQYFSNNQQLSEKIQEIWNQQRSAYSGWVYELTWQKYATNIYRFLISL